MKKFAVLLVFIIAGTALAKGQNRKVTSAFNYLRQNKIEKALDAIEPATKHKRTRDEAKTWFYRGNIYLGIHMSEDEAVKKLAENPLDTAYTSYKKAFKLDEEEGDYTDELKDRMKYISEQFFNEGVNKYKSKDYQSAMEGFINAAKINRKYRDKIDTAAFYYAGNSADLAGNSDTAMKYYKKAKEYNYDNHRLYSSLSRLYSAKGDTSKALAVVNEGLNKYPDVYDLIITETNIFLAQGDTEKALENLKVAVEKDTTNPTLWFAAGVNYEQMMKDKEADSLKKLFMDEAVNAYEKALEIKPDYYKPAFNLGAIYVNRAATLQNMANQLPLNETAKYDKLKKEADSTLQKAVPYLEKARKIKPDDLNALQSLKEIYARLNQTEKLKKITKEIQKLTQGSENK